MNRVRLLDLQPVASAAQVIGHVRREVGGDVRVLHEAELLPSRDGCHDDRFREIGVMMGVFVSGPVFHAFIVLSGRDVVRR